MVFVNLTFRHPCEWKEACLEANSSHLTPEFCIRDTQVLDDVKHVGLYFMHFKLGVSHCISAFLCVSLVFLSRLPVLHAAWLPSPLAFTTWAEVPVYARACIRPSTVALHLCISLLFLGPVVQTELLERLAVTIVIAAVLNRSVQCWGRGEKDF